MAKPFLIILGTALCPSDKIVTTHGEKRLEQYIGGFEKVFELSQKYTQFDFVISDNTIPPDWQMDEKLDRVISKIDGIRKVFFYDNELAVRNKGCGVVAGWKKVIASIDLVQYSHCIYFEPRQQLLNFSFFDNFLEKPGNYFKVMKYRATASTKSWPIKMLLRAIPIYKTQFNSGLFSLEREAFWKYAAQIDLQNLADNSISLEDDMMKISKLVKFVSVENLGLRWHEAATNKYFDY